MTKLANIEDADTVVTKVEAGDGVIKVTTKTKGVPSEENIEAGKVKSVNGRTGNVVVGKIADIAIDGTTVTITFADGTTKTLTTQDTNVDTKVSLNYSAKVSVTSSGYTAPSDGMLILSLESGGGTGTMKVYLNGSQIASIRSNTYTSVNTITLPVTSGDKITWDNNVSVYSGSCFVPFK